MMQEAADKDGTKPEANEKPHMNGDFVDFQEDFRAEDRYLQVSGVSSGKHTVIDEDRHSS